MAFVGLNAPHAAGLSVSRTFSAGLATAGACGVLIASAVLNFMVSDHLPHRFFDAMLALGLTGILYVTTRDLLLEIQDELKTGLRTRLFCMDYLLFLVFHMVVGCAGRNQSRDAVISEATPRRLASAPPQWRNPYYSTGFG